MNTAVRSLKDSQAMWATLPLGPTAARIHLRSGTPWHRWPPLKPA